jgi:hypothetical protein
LDTRKHHAIGRKAGGENLGLAGLPHGDWANDEREKEGSQERNGRRKSGKELGKVYCIKGRIGLD